MTYIADTRFSELIQQLEAVHLREVKDLWLENQRLRSMSPRDVHYVDVQGFTVDIDSPDLEKECSFSTCRPNSAGAAQGSRTPSFEEVDKGTNVRGKPSTIILPVSPGGQSSSTFGRVLSKRAIAQQYEKRTHWESAPESAQAAWEQAADFDGVEEYTAYAMAALSKHIGVSPRGSFVMRKSRLSRPLARRKSLSPKRSLNSKALQSRLFHFICKVGMPMVDPGTTHRVAWDFIAAFLIVYDLITIPLLVFDPEDSLFTDFMGWACLVFWTLDIWASVCTGIYIDGQLVMSRNIVVRRYLKSWFVVDCLAVVPHWILNIFDSARAVGIVGGLMRMARGTRVLRLLRLAKLKKLMNEFYDMISNEYMFIVVDLVKLLTMILLLNHIVACLWYAVGSISRHTGAATNWLEDTGRSPVYHGSFAWKYSTCLQWSITQFTAASLDVYATNTGERIFSVMIVFWGLVGLSSFVGSVTTTIAVLRHMSNDNHKQFWLLRKYLAQCRISQHLTVRILRYLEFKAAAKKNILPPSKVVLLSQLSEQLSSQLKKEANHSIFDVHPFFGVLSLQLTPSMDQVCNQALMCNEYAEHDFVFCTAQDAVGMFFVKAGTFRYSEKLVILKNGYMSEAALWTSWSHRENLVASGDVNEIISILHERFGEVMCMHPEPWNFAQSYATDFVKALNDHDPESLTDISMENFVKSLGEKSPKKSNIRKSRSSLATFDGGGPMSVVAMSSLNFFAGQNRRAHN